MQSILDSLPDAWKVIVGIIAALGTPIAVAYFSYKKDLEKYRIDKASVVDLSGDGLKASFRMPIATPTFDLQTANDLIRAFERNTQAHLDSARSTDDATRAARDSATEIRRLEEALRVANSKLAMLASRVPNSGRED